MAKDHSFPWNWRLLLALPALLFFCSCASAPRTETVLEPVRPAPVIPAAHGPGYLVVYTAIIEPDINPDTMFYPHTGYAIYDSQGVYYQTVRNHVGRWDETPYTVSLPPGRYMLKAESQYDGDVQVPVIIEGGKTTVVDLQHRDHRVARS
ncbi:MAG TPA: hypothetical protein VGM54_09505 [Chthoniobacter sp.]|jgi:hypothetical protein